MRKLAALSGALLLTLAMAAPAAANQKVWIPEFSGAFEWEQVMDVSTCTGPPYWEGWCDGWECIGPNDERLYYTGDWSGDMWLWYAKGIDTTDPAEYKPSDRPWPWIKGAAKGRGIDTYSTDPNMGGKVLSGKYNSNERSFSTAKDVERSSRADPPANGAMLAACCRRRWSQLHPPARPTSSSISASGRALVGHVEQVRGADSPASCG